MDGLGQHEPIVTEHEWTMRELAFGARRQGCARVVSDQSASQGANYSECLAFLDCFPPGPLAAHGLRLSVGWAARKTSRDRWAIPVVSSRPLSRVAG